MHKLNALFDEFKAINWKMKKEKSHWSPADQHMCVSSPNPIKNSMKTTMLQPKWGEKTLIGTAKDKNKSN